MHSVWRFGLSLMASLIVLVSGCAAPKIKTDVLMPGRFSEPAQFKSVAVLPFDGPDGNTFSSVIEAKLAGIIIHDKQYFQLIDRKVLDKTLEEMKLGMSGVVDSSKAAQIGKMTGAKGIYTGTVSASSVSDGSYTEKRSKCVSYKEVTDSKGRKSKECANTQEYTVNCAKRTATFGFTPKLVEVESSKIIYSNALDGAAEDQQCSDSGTALKDGLTLKKEAQAKAADKFRLDVAPYYATIEIELMDSNDGIDSSAAKEKLKMGLDFAKNGRLDRACEIWSESRSMAPNSISYLYNVGVCSEVKGQLVEAQTLYKQADKQLAKPNESITVALNRVNDAIAKQKKLSSQIAPK